LAIHGHQFDRFIVNNALLSGLGEFIYLQLQRVDTRDNFLSHWLDRMNSRWLRLTPKVARGALSYARGKGCDVVFCGHTHQAYQAAAGGVQYFNTGCWTHESPTFITVADGEVRTHHFSPRAFAGFDLLPEEVESGDFGTELQSA
jgi:UDP-2,3-diacylglucosamine pyrophosphatase LpxH